MLRIHAWHVPPASVGTGRPGYARSRSGERLCALLRLHLELASCIMSSAERHRALLRLHLELNQLQHVGGRVAVLMVRGDDPGDIIVLDALAFDFGEAGDADGEVGRSMDEREDQISRPVAVDDPAGHDAADVLPLLGLARGGETHKDEVRTTPAARVSPRSRVSASAETAS